MVFETNIFNYVSTLIKKIKGISLNGVNRKKANPSHYKVNLVRNSITNTTQIEHKVCSQKSCNVANVRSSRQVAKKLQFLS